MTDVPEIPIPPVAVTVLAQMHAILAQMQAANACQANQLDELRDERHRLDVLGAQAAGEVERLRAMLDALEGALRARGVVACCQTAGTTEGPSAARSYGPLREFIGRPQGAVGPSQPDRWIAPPVQKRGTGEVSE